MNGMQLKVYPDRSTFQDLARKGNLIPVWVEILADTETPVSALAKMRHPEGPAFLLESVEGGERWARYSFLGTSARCQLRVYRDTVQIRQRHSETNIPHHGDPLAVLRSVLSQ